MIFRPLILGLLILLQGIGGKGGVGGKGGFGGVKGMPVPSGLLDSWPMNEGSGTVFIDNNAAASNPTNLSTTLSDGAWGSVSGWPSTPFTFNGTHGGSVVTPAAPNYDLTSWSLPFSVCTWINAASFPAGEAGFVSTLNSAFLFPGWELEATGSGHLQFYIINTVSGNDMIQVASTGTLSTGANTQVCATYSGSRLASGVILYINGSSVSTSVVQNGLSATNAHSSSLGVAIRVSSTGGFSDPFTGTLGYASVWSCALSSGVISANNSAGPSFTGLHC